MWFSETVHVALGFIKEYDGLQHHVVVILIYKAAVPGHPLPIVYNATEVWRQEVAWRVSSYKSVTTIFS